MFRNIEILVNDFYVLFIQDHKRSCCDNTYYNSVKAFRIPRAYKLTLNCMLLACTQPSTSTNKEP